MRRIISVIIFIIYITITTLASCSSAEIKNKITVVVSIPFEKYILKQVLGNLAEVKTLISGEYEPHLQTLTQEMISSVLNSDIYVPVYHFEFEYRLIRLCTQYNIPFVTIDMHRLKLLRYPHIGTLNTHGWWILPENAITLANYTIDTLCRQFPELSSYLTRRLIMFERDVKRVLNVLKSVSVEISLYRKRNHVLIVCAPPAQYLLYSINNTCDIILSERVQLPSLIISLEKHKGPIVALLANFQRGSELSRMLKELIKRKGGTILYIPFIGLKNLNITYTEFLLMYTYEILGAVKSASLRSELKAKHTSTNELLLYTCILLGTLLLISVIINLSLLRRV